MISITTTVIDMMYSMQYLPTTLTPGRLFPHEPVNFVHRKWTVSQEISQNISKVLTNLTYFYHFVDEKSLEFQQI